MINDQLKIELSKRGSTLAESINLEISYNIQKIINQYDLNASNQIKNNLENLSWDMYLFRKKLKVK